MSRIDAGGDLALVAGRDLTLQGSKLAAGDNLVLQAVQDLRLEALSNTQTFSSNRSSGSITTHQVVDIQAGGDAALSAGRDALLQGSRVDAGGALALVAGRDVDIQAVVDERSVESRGAVRRGSYQRSEFDQTVHGAELTAGGDIAIVGGRDVTLEAAYVGSDAGGVAIGAGRDLSLIAAEEQHNFEQTTQTKKSGLFSSKRTTTYDRVDETLAVGTTISGETVDLSAGRDMSLIAAQVAGTGDVSLMAGRDLLIGGAQETYSATHDTQTRKSGLFGSGGIGVTWGTRETRNTADIEETTHIGSLIGSSAGRVDIVAGGDVAIVGSDVLSKAGIGISGENVAIVAADSTMSVEERQTMRQSGLNISLSGGVIDTAMAVYGAARRATEVDDDRLAALYAAKAGQTFAGAGNMATDASGQFAALANTDQNTAGGGGSSGINLRIGYGASSSTSTSELAQNTHTGSRIGSEGDVSIVARSGDLAVVGSTIDGDNIALVAANDILLRSSQDVSTHTSRSESQSGEVGITIGTEAGIGVYVAAAMAKGRGDGSGLVHNETVVTAANGLTFVSGNDTTLQGAQLIGETVTGRVGGNFTLISEQDADTFDRKDTSISGSAAIGFGGGSASVTLAQSKVNSDYLSVREQTGVQAGGGGFDIAVGGHTQLDGAALASATADNRLSTGTLGWSDLENRAEYSASSISVTAGTSGGFSPSLGLPQSGDASSTTRAGIAAGIIEVRSDETALDGLNRDVAALQQAGLDTIFNERKVAEQAELAGMLGPMAFNAAGTLAERAGWEEGSPQKTLLHGAVGAAVSALTGGNALDGALGASGNQIAFKAIAAALEAGGLVEGTKAFNDLAELASLAVGAALGGRGGAASALLAEQFNRQLHLDEAKVLEGLKKDASPEAASRLDAAACALAKCAEGVPSSDPNYANLVALQAKGERYTAEQSTLLATGLFRYSDLDASNDWLLSQDRWVSQVGSGIRTVGGAAGAVGGVAGGVVSSPACTTVVGCIAPIGMFTLAGYSAKDGWEASQELFAPYNSTQGQRVIDSFLPATHWGAQNPSVDLAGNVGASLLGTFAAKFGGRLLTSRPVAADVVHQKPIHVADGSVPPPATGSGIDSQLNPAFIQQRNFWTSDPVNFGGNKVYQRNDLFDPGLQTTWIEGGKSVTGTNIERMASGRAPMGTDGKFVNLHHMTQSQDGPLAEMTQTFHRINSRTIHINPSSIPSGINLSQFDAWKARYWKDRAAGF
ncbi:hemagglutinin repeat-containing protein [Luteimonas sp. WGS1318]|uniref:hemagglutinin repeat-containing protein n=1 Tax=Luteimonas sp. WGS1318 TaxID=3366815 RepID=UPI00372D5EE9